MSARATVGILLALAAPAAAQHTRNVIFLTVDGVRQQELFEGADPILLEAGDKSGIEDERALRERFWRDTTEKRREALLPFFWTELAPAGIVMRSTISNPHRNSYPGYSELLTGRVVSEITGNIDLQNPAQTVLEIVRRELDLGPLAVAAVTSWGHFPFIVESQPGTIFVNAGVRDVPTAFANREIERWNRLQHRMPSPWDSVRYNAVTLGIASELLELYQPRLLFIALDETDEWAHSRRYDRTLQAIRSFDDALRALWAKVQALPAYRGRTTLVVTTDHGRGLTTEEWTSHGEGIDGAENTWIAILGPDTPASGSVDTPAENRQVAATLLSLLGLEPALLGREAGASIPLARRAQ